MRALNLDEKSWSLYFDQNSSWLRSSSIADLEPCDTHKRNSALPSQLAAICFPLLFRLFFFLSCDNVAPSCFSEVGDGYFQSNTITISLLSFFLRGQSTLTDIAETLNLDCQTENCRIGNGLWGGAVLANF